MIVDDGAVVRCIYPCGVLVVAYRVVIAFHIATSDDDDIDAFFIIHELTGFNLIVPSGWRVCSYPKTVSFLKK